MTEITNYEKINFKTELTLDERNELVKALIDVTADYYKAKSFGVVRVAQAMLIINSLTDIEVEKLNPDEVWELMTKSNIMTDIEKSLGSMYKEMMLDVDNGVKYCLSADEQVNKFFTTLNEFADAAKEKLNSIDVDKITEMLQEMALKNNDEKDEITS